MKVIRIASVVAMIASGLIGSSNVVAISRQHLDGSKLEAATGFVPEVRFVEGLQRTVEFYRSHYERARVFASV